MIAKDIRERIALLRFIMIFGVVILHTPEHVYINDIGSSWFDLTKAFFQNAAFRCSVPVLTCISGFLLFSTNLDRQYRKLLDKKIRTLAIPFLVFNTTMAIGLLIAEAYGHIPVSVQLYPLNAEKLLDALFALRGTPVNYPLYFLRDLFVLMLLAPIFGWLIRKVPFQGMVLIGLIGFTNFDGDLFLRQQMPMTFYIGGLAAIQKWDLRRLDAFALPCFLLFFSSCCAIVYFKVGNTLTLRLLAPFLIWPASSLLYNSMIGRFFAAKSSYSFFIFLTHAPVVLVLSLAYKHFKEFIPYEVYWTVAPLLTVCILIFLQDFLLNTMPRAFSNITGSKRSEIKISTKHSTSYYQSIR